MCSIQFSYKSTTCDKTLKYPENVIFRFPLSMLLLWNYTKFRYVATKLAFHVNSTVYKIFILHVAFV